MAAGTSHANSVIDAALILLKRLVLLSIPQRDSENTKFAVIRLLELLRGPNTSSVRYACDTSDDETRYVNNNNASP